MMCTLVLGSSTSALMPFSTMSFRAFSIRACRSSSAIGVAVPGNGLSAAIGAGALVAAGVAGRVCASAGA